MIIRTAADLAGTTGDKQTEFSSSLRFLHQIDGMGVTLTDTTIHAGKEREIWYKNHLEACYCIEGEGTIEDLLDGKTHQLRAGTLYALDKNDRHLLRAHTNMRLICVFNPALKEGERPG